MSTDLQASGVRGFAVTFDPFLRIHIKFCTGEQAGEYLRRAKQRSVYRDNALDGQVQSNIVTMRLPSRVGCVAFFDGHGYLAFKDKVLARKWVHGLIIWTFLNESDGRLSEDKVGLRRGLTNEQLNLALGITAALSDEASQRSIAPKPAVPSAPSSTLAVQSESGTKLNLANLSRLNLIGPRLDSDLNTR
ncbi:hypothetical protein C7999DRAFT_28072 [Corynascus novoguineensis]|uniref:Uncharacterized protein n=1 Tax=Corynascus novoguineensis TaxID=1126955 RepID=A0AAN7HND3_9PEZI|nr:hypothetical protein C7999DRAFT_28072 [Corynascus novoguineensis]